MLLAGSVTPRAGGSLPEREIRTYGQTLRR
jgi:hypothetical protein